jgi:hypothetical protein
MLRALVPFFLLAGHAARADEPQPWSLAFVGGGMFPQGEMSAATRPGLDVGTRVGWSSKSGIGLQLGLAFAPLRQRVATEADSQLFAGTLGPRFTLGRDVLRVWIAGAGGLVLERASAVSSAFTVNGLGGLDLHVFGNGGFTFSGEYVRSVSTGAYQYLAVTGGLIFTM